MEINSKLAEHGGKKKVNASKFKKHMMYDPKTGKGKMANKPKTMKRLAKKDMYMKNPKMDERVEMSTAKDMIAPAGWHQSLVSVTHL